MAKSERISTGISGLDKMLNGGLPPKQNVLVTGGPGTGKTSFCMQFLYQGAQDGEKGLFISLEEKPERIIDNCAAAFPGWTGFRDHIKKKNINVTKIDKWTYEQFIDTITTYVSQFKTTRCVIDSLSVMELYFDKPHEYRKRLFDMMTYLSGMECTTLITHELPTGESTKMKYPLAQYVADGVIALYKLEKQEKRVRALEVIKMRGTDHSTDLVPIAITPSGVRVYEGEKVY